jgi:hypothetical protein
MENPYYSFTVPVFANTLEALKPILMLPTPLLLRQAMAMEMIK